MPAMQGLFRYIPLMLLAFLIFAGSVHAEDDTGDIAAEAEVKAFSSVDNASLALYAGQNALRGGRYDEAAAYFTEAVKADPSFLAAWYLKAYSLRQLNRTREAMAAVDQALLLDPNDRDANRLRAELLESLGRGDDAARYQSAAPPGHAAPLNATPATVISPSKAPVSPFICLFAIMVAVFHLGGEGRSS